MAIEDQQDQLASRKTGGHKRALGYLLGLLIFFCLAVYYDINWSRLVDAILLVEPLKVGFAVGLFALHGAINAVAYTFLQQSLSSHCHPKRCIQIWLISQPGKYLPGGLWSYVSRAALLKKEGVPLKASITALTLEQIISLTIVILIAIVAWMVISFDTQIKQLIVLLAALATVVGGLLAWRSQSAYLPVFPIVCYSVSMVPYFLAYLLIFQGEIVTDLIIALFTSTATGIVTLIVPGGLGVREAGLIALMPKLDASEAASYALLSRAAIVISEFMLASAASAVYFRRQPGQ